MVNRIFTVYFLSYALIIILNATEHNDISARVLRILLVTPLRKHMIKASHPKHHRAQVLFLLGSRHGFFHELIQVELQTGLQPRRFVGTRQIPLALERGFCLVRRVFALVSLLLFLETL